MKKTIKNTITENVPAFTENVPVFILDNKDANVSQLGRLVQADKNIGLAKACFKREKEIFTDALPVLTTGKNKGQKMAGITYATSVFHKAGLILDGLKDKKSGNFKPMSLSTFNNKISEGFKPKTEIRESYRVLNCIDGLLKYTPKTEADPVLVELCNVFAAFRKDPIESFDALVVAMTSFKVKSVDKANSKPAPKPAPKPKKTPVPSIVMPAPSSAPASA